MGRAKAGEMAIRSIAPWFGGKRSLAKLIVAQLGERSQYFEPFCGSMAVLLAKPVWAQETANDLHGDATNLAWVLQCPAKAERLYARVSRTLFAEDMIRAMWRELAHQPAGAEVDEDRAYQYFVFSWAMRNGVSGTSRIKGNGFQIALRFTAGGGSPTVRFRSAVESIPYWHERLRNVSILRRNAFDLLTKFEDAEQLAIYADPPYHKASRAGWESTGATSRYEHDFEHESPLFGDDHTRLRDALARFTRARVVVSYYDCPEVRRLYRGWTFLEATTLKTITAQNHRGKEARQVAREVLILNGPVYGTCEEETTCG